MHIGLHYIKITIKRNIFYYRHVLVNPKERKVVVVESLLTPTLFRETLAKVLFLHYEVRLMIQKHFFASYGTLRLAG